MLALISKAVLLGVDQQQLAQAQQACVSRNMSAASALQAALHASPFSMDIFRLRLLDAKRLGLGNDVKSSQGGCPPTTQAACVACRLYTSLLSLVLHFCLQCSALQCSMYGTVAHTTQLALLKRCTALVWRQCSLRNLPSCWKHHHRGGAFVTVDIHMSPLHLYN